MFEKEVANKRDRFRGVVAKGGSIVFLDQLSVKERNKKIADALFVER